MDKKIKIFSQVVRFLLVIFLVSLGTAWLEVSGVIKLERYVFTVCLFGMMSVGYLLATLGLFMWATKWPRRVNWLMTAVAFLCLAFAMIAQGILFGGYIIAYVGILIAFVVICLLLEHFYKGMTEERG